jgi:hypothetical protein
VHAPHVIPSTLSVVVATCAVAPFGEGAMKPEGRVSMRLRVCTNAL